MDCSPPGSSMGFPRQEYWSGLPFPSSGGPPDPWIKPALPTLAGGFFTTKPPGNPLRTLFIEVLISVSSLTLFLACQHWRVWKYVCVQFSHSVVSDSLWPHGLQHTRLPCPSQTPGACSDSCPSIWWCHPTISSSVDPFSSCLQSFPASGSFPRSQFFPSGGQYWNFSFSISPSNEYSRLISFRIDWFDLLAVQGTLKSLLQDHSSKASILQCSAFFIVQLSYPYITTGKTIALTRQTFVSKVMSLLFNKLSRLVIDFLPRNKCLLISWLQSPSAVVLEHKKIICHCFPIYLPWSDRTRYHDHHFLNVES